MNNFLRIITASMVCFGLAAATHTAHAQVQAPAAPAPKPAVPAPTTQPAVDRGERAFKANCNRCHNAPESLNSRITGTVIRHMRVRANLSAEDERDILHFLNP